MVDLKAQLWADWKVVPMDQKKADKKVRTLVEVLADSMVDSMAALKAGLMVVVKAGLMVLTKAGLKVRRMAAQWVAQMVLQMVVSSAGLRDQRWVAPKVPHWVEQLAAHLVDY